MKTITTILASLLLVMASCSKADQPAKESVIPENGLVTLHREISLPAASTRSTVLGITATFDLQKETHCK